MKQFSASNLRLKSVGWLKQYRGIKKLEVFKHSDLYQLWSYLYGEALAHDLEIDGNYLRPGHLLTSRKRIAEDLGISEHAVERRLKRLLKLNEIVEFTFTKYRIFYLTRWNELQKNNQENWDIPKDLMETVFKKYLKNPHTTCPPKENHKLKPETCRENFYFGTKTGQFSIKTAFYSVKFKQGNSPKVLLSKQVLKQKVKNPHTYNNDQFHYYLSIIKDQSSMDTVYDLLSLSKKQRNNNGTEGHFPGPTLLSNESIVSPERNAENSFKIKKTKELNTHTGNKNIIDVSGLFDQNKSSELKKLKSEKNKIINIPSRILDSYHEKIQILENLNKILGFKHKLPPVTSLFPASQSKLVLDCFSVLQDIKTGNFHNYKFNSRWMSQFKVTEWPGRADWVSWEEISTQLAKSAQNYSESLKNTKGEKYKNKSLLKFLYNRGTQKSNMLKYLNVGVQGKNHILSQNFFNKISDNAKIPFEKLYNDFVAKRQGESKDFYWANVYNLEKWYESNIMELYILNYNKNWSCINRFERLALYLNEYSQEKCKWFDDILDVSSKSFFSFTSWLLYEHDATLQVNAAQADKKGMEMWKNDSDQKIVIDEKRQQYLFEGMNYNDASNMAEFSWWAGFKRKWVGHTLERMRGVV